MKRLLLGIVMITLALVIGIPLAVNRLSPARIQDRGVIVHMYVHSTGKVVEIPLEEYVTGVVAAEMPAEFPVEALKAQAVAARTYITRRMTGGGVTNPIHPGADVCDDPKHYQGWFSREDMKKRWGSGLDYYRYYARISAAVYATRGELITWGGQLIDPVYHSSCGGKGTENAAEVWKFDVPYLKGVSCPWDAETQPVRETMISYADLAGSLGGDANVMQASSGKKDFFEVIDRTASGRPRTVRIGEVEIIATMAREKLGLRSAMFDMQPAAGGVRVQTVGYGHGVGMCQYGAKGMALEGYGYREILKYYYTGVELINMEIK